MQYKRCFDIFLKFSSFVFDWLFFVNKIPLTFNVRFCLVVLVMCKDCRLFYTVYYMLHWSRIGHSVEITDKENVNDGKKQTKKSHDNQINMGKSKVETIAISIQSKYKQINVAEKECKVVKYTNTVDSGNTFKMKLRVGSRLFKNTRNDFII